MRHLLLGTYSFLCLLGIALLTYFIPNNTPEFLGYGIPSSALPNLCAFSITFFSAVEWIKTYRNKEDKRPSSISTQNLLHLVKFVSVAFLTFPTMDIIGFIPGAMLSLLAFQYLCGQREYKALIIITICVPIIIYLVATHLLLITLPEGVFTWNLF